MLHSIGIKYLFNFSKCWVPSILKSSATVLRGFDWNHFAIRRGNLYLLVHFYCKWLNNINFASFPLTYVLFLFLNFFLLILLLLSNLTFHNPICTLLWGMKIKHFTKTHISSNFFVIFCNIYFLNIQCQTIIVLKLESDKALLD